MDAPSSRQLLPDSPSPEPHSAPLVAGPEARAAAATEAFGDTAAGYIQTYPLRAVLAAAALGVLAGLLAARARR